MSCVLCELNRGKPCVLPVTFRLVYCCTRYPHFCMFSISTRGEPVFRVLFNRIKLGYRDSVLALTQWEVGVVKCFHKDPSNAIAHHRD